MRLIAVILVFNSIAISAYAQNIENMAKQKPVSISGSLSTTASIYATSDTSSHRDPYSTLLSGNFNLSLYGISMPFSIMYSNQNFDYAQPFNRVGVSPEYKWIKLHLGYRSISHSSFTLAGHSFLGAGLELTPGKLRFSSAYGRFKKKMVPNSINPIDTLYSPTRKGYSVKLGVGDNKNYLDFIFLNIRDDSIGDDNFPQESSKSPQANMVLGTQFKLSISKHITWETEGALSLLTKDFALDSSILPDNKILEKVNAFFPVNETSHYSTALKSSLQYSLKTFNMGLEYRRIDPNYQSFGAYYFNTDMENITMNSSFRFFKKKLLLKGSVGVQNDNLKNNKSKNSRRFISRFNFDYNTGKVFGINGNFSNYSINQFAGNLPLNDTIKLYQSNRNISLTPRLTFVQGTMTQMVQLNVNQMDLIDHNENTSENNKVNSRMLMLNYIRNYQSLGLSLSAGLNRTHLQTVLEDRRMTGISIGAGKVMFKNKLSVNFALTNSSNEIKNDSAPYKGNVFTTMFNLNYRPHKSHTFRCNIYLNRIQYPNEALLKSYNESKIIFNYGYSFR